MKRPVEEALVALWNLEERGRNQYAELLAAISGGEGPALLEEMEASGLIRISDAAVRFTREGHRLAERLIRRHRLAERLMHDVFQTSEAEMEKMACEFEHILSEEVTDSVCTFLGHPPTCPHGNPIPRGECCRTFRKELRPLVAPLTEFEVGKQGKIVYITTQHHTRMDRLNALGILPGSVVRLHQKRPSIILQIDQTNIAIETDIAREIYVKPV